MAYDLGPLTARLEALSEPRYAEFSRGLIPGIEGTALGVRMPALRAIAKELIASDDWRGFLEATRDHTVYELRMLHAMVLGGARCPAEEQIALTDAFLLHVDNWAICDGLCSSFKPRARSREAVFDFACACARSEPEFRVRFGLVMLMNRYRDEAHLRRVMAIYRAFRHDAFYARMGAAWGLATLWSSAREDCLSILKENLWDAATHNLAIRKLCESRRIPEADKALARSLRRTGDASI